MTIRIYDFGMNYVRTIIQNAPRNFNIDSGIEPVTWNGKDDGGNIVPNGIPRSPTNKSLVCFNSPEADPISALAL